MARLLLLVMLAFSFSTLAQSEKEFIWHDGKMAKKIYQKNNLLMEFKSKNQGVVLHHVSLATQKRMLESRSAPFSAVFSDSPGAPWSRALPGGVVVAFATHLNETAVRQLAQRHALHLEKKLALSGHNIWQARTASGIASLEKAQSLQGQAGILWCSPNWLENLRSH